MLRQLSRRFLLVIMFIAAVMVFSGTLFAQGRSEEAFERVKAVQERHTQRLMAINDVEGTAIGLDENDQPALHVFTARPGVGNIPNVLDGVPVRIVVSGKFYAFPKPETKPGGGTKIPKTPTGLTATVVSSTQIDLTWNAIKGRIDHYNVYRFDVLDNPIGWSVDTSYSDGELAPSMPYSYVVTAVDQDGVESGYSNEASATTLPGDGGGDTIPPAAPGSLTATAVSDSRINLNWADNIESDLSHYNIYRSTTTNSYNDPPIASVDKVDGSSFSDTGLPAETTYYYVVTAVDTSNNQSNPSNQAWDTTYTAPIEHPPMWYPRPVPIGVSTGHPLITAGTIACRVKDSAGNVYALSNNHVYANSNNAIIGDNVLQPGVYDDGQDPRDAIGTLFAFQEIDFDGGSNIIDAAIALTTVGQVGNSTPAGSYGLPKSTPYPTDADYLNLVNLMVQKHGRTTSRTYGGVFSVNATINVNYGTEADPKIATFVEQIMIVGANLDYFSLGGDSGSLIVTYPERQPVGLLFAGGSLYGIIPITIANPIGPVLDRFNVTVDGEQP